MIKRKSPVTAQDSDRLTANIRSRINEYGVNGDTTTLDMVKRVDRRYCTLLLYRTTPSSRDPSLVAKVSIGFNPSDNIHSQENAIGVDGPRLVDKVFPSKRAKYEYDSLQRIADHFGALQHPYFGYVHVCDWFPQDHAIVMQWIQQPILRSLLLRALRIRTSRKARELDPAFYNLGSWLHEHHQLEPNEHCVTRNVFRDDFMAAVEQFVAYLTDNLPNKKAATLHDLHDAIRKQAEKYLPVSIRTGQLHGDFAARNVFVGPRDRVTVFDTHGRFEAPIYEDIAKLLVTVKACGVQIGSKGLLLSDNRLRCYEQRFLEGYFGAHAIPWESVRLFESQLILELWANMVFQHLRAHSVRRAAKGTRRQVWELGFLSYLKKNISELS